LAANRSQTRAITSPVPRGIRDYHRGGYISQIWKTSRNQDYVQKHWFKRPRQNLRKKLRNRECQERDWVAQAAKDKRGSWSAGEEEGQFIKGEKWTAFKD